MSVKWRAKLAWLRSYHGKYAAIYTQPAKVVLYNYAMGVYYILVKSLHKNKPSVTKW